jgi:MFS family permease
LCVLLIVVGVREPEPDAKPPARKQALRLSGATRLDRRFWLITAVAVVLTLARFSEAFLLLRGDDVGMGAAGAPWVMVAMTSVYALLALPAGVLADRGHAKALLMAGFAALIAADLVLAGASDATGVLIGAGLWGLHLALTQGLLSALIAAVAPASLRGTAFGVYGLASGIALLVASTLAGALWQLAGPAATFHAGALFAALAWAGLVGVRPRMPPLDGVQR